MKGPCSERQTGAFALCDFLPDGRDCCPNQHPLSLPFPGSNVGASCGVLRSAFQSSQSSRWTDSDCRIVKSTIESVVFNIDGCVCPGSPLLDTDPPTTRSPTISSRPSTSPSLSGEPSHGPSTEPSSSISPSELPTVLPSESPSMTPSLRPSRSVLPSSLPSSPRIPIISISPTGAREVASEQPSIVPSLTPSASVSPSEKTETTCSERPGVDRLCYFRNTCCIEGNGGLVRIPNATNVFCHQALAIFQSDESKAFTDNECYLMLLGIESELGDECSCRDFFCFSGKSTVHVRDRGDIEMNRLKIGDMVLTGKDIYEPVYSFGHHGEGIQARLLKISTARESFEISPEHMVLTKSSSSPASFFPASSLKKGSILFNEIGQETVIQSIQVVTSNGIFAPFTPSGRLLVNGIVVSSFVALETDLGIQIMGVPVSHQWLAHMFEFPHRVICHHLGTCLKESYTKDGISTWVDYPLRLSQCLLNLPNGLFKTAVLVIILGILCTFSFLEFLLVTPEVLISILFLSLLLLPRIIHFKQKQA